MASDLDREYVINGDDLRIALADLAGKPLVPSDAARDILQAHARLLYPGRDPWAPDEVVDAHIHCDHVLNGPASDELEAMNQIVGLLSPRSTRSVKRILAWTLDRLTDIGEPPF